MKIMTRLHEFTVQQYINNSADMKQFSVCLSLIFIWTRTKDSNAIISSTSAWFNKCLTVCVCVCVCSHRSCARSSHRARPCLRISIIFILMLLKQIWVRSSSLCRAAHWSEQRVAHCVLRAAPCVLRTAYSRVRYIFIIIYFFAELVKTYKNRETRHESIPAKNNHKNKDRKLILWICVHQIIVLRKAQK